MEASPEANAHPMILHAGRSHLVETGLLVSAVVIAYLNAFHGAFQYDDFRVIVDNPAVHSGSAWLGSLGGIRPLLKASYLLNWAVGTSPFGFHVVNVALHTLNALLLYTILLRFPAQGEDLKVQKIQERAAFFTALLWALHPVQTEAVTYICGRSVSLMATFYLGSVLAYIHGRERGSRAHQWLLSPLLFLLAFLTKETALTLPAALALWEFTARWDRKHRYSASAVHWALLAGMAVFLALNADYARLLTHGFQTRGWLDNLRSQIHAVAWLITSLSWPAHQNIDPLLPLMHRWSWSLACEAALLLGLLAAGLGNLRRRRWFAFGILWGFLQFLPTNSLVPRLDLANERQLYLASQGFIFVVCMGLLHAFEGWPHKLRWLQIGFATLAVGLGLLTMIRNQDYRSETTLWESSVRADPDNPRAFNNLGTAYSLAGDNGKAALAYREALRLRPDYPLARKNLAAVEP